MAIANALAEKVVTSGEFSSFLKNWIAFQFPDASLTGIARKCGIFSKGSLHDILSGRRRPSFETVRNLARGLKITGPERALFLKLWELSKAGNRNANSDAFLDELREKIRTKNSKKKYDRIPSLAGWDHVYAALGPCEKGATLGQISDRTGITKKKCDEILTQLLKLELAEHVADRDVYRARVLHGVFETGSNAEKEYLVGKAAGLRKRVAENFENAESALFRSFVFSVSPDRFPELRNRMKRLLDDFVDESENPSGSSIAELFMAFEVLRNRS